MIGRTIQHLFVISLRRHFRIDSGEFSKKENAIEECGNNMEHTNEAPM